MNKNDDVLQNKLPLTNNEQLYRGSKRKDDVVESLSSSSSSASSSVISSESNLSNVYQDNVLMQPINSKPELNVSELKPQILLSPSEMPEDFPPIEPKGTVLASIMNLSNTILGAGLLAMPAALANVGLIPGAVFIVFSGVISAFGLRLLTDCAAVVGRTSSFSSISQLTFPSASLFFDVAIAIKCFGVSVSYLVIVGELIPQIVMGISPALGEDGSESMLLEPWFWITAALLSVTPLTFLRSLTALRFTSFIALGAATYLVLLVIFFSVFPDESIPKPDPEDLPWFDFGYDWFTTVPIFVFAFTCHQNIFAIYNELINNTKNRIRRVINTAIGVSMGFYEIVGIIGFFAFGKTVKSNIIAMYPTSPSVILGQVAILLLVILSYPLQCHPCRLSLDKIIIRRKPEKLSKTPLIPTAQSESSDLGKKDGKASSTVIPTGRFIALTIGIIASTYLVAVTVRDLTLVLALVGASGSTTICYILPGIFYYKMYNKGLVGHAQFPAHIDDNLIIDPLSPNSQRRISLSLGGENTKPDSSLSVNVISNSLVNHTSSRYSISTGENGSTTLLLDSKKQEQYTLHPIPSARPVYIGSILLATWGVIVMVLSLSTQLIKIFSS